MNVMLISEKCNIKQKTVDPTKTWDQEIPKLFYSIYILVEEIQR